jgi:hypothetical protein
VADYVCALDAEVPQQGAAIGGLLRDVNNQVKCPPVIR